MIEFENTVIVITARMACKSLPGRPMANINGQPMVVHALKAAQNANIGHVLVAAAENQIAEAVRAVGGDALVSPLNSESEIDQIAAVLTMRDQARRYEFVMNVPCYLPGIEALSLRRCLAGLTNADVDVATLAAPLADDDGSQMKVLAALEGEREVAYARDFSKAVQPQPAWQHIGVFAYRRSSLEKIAALKSPAHEKATLGALENGFRVAVVKVDMSPLSVDTPQHLEAARRLMKA
jgi:3-deoxy-manno-octulosonate cytidylyltransferase (CMP-KDO synthetase)